MEWSLNSQQGDGDGDGDGDEVMLEHICNGDGEQDGLGFGQSSLAIVPSGLEFDHMKEEEKQQGEYIFDDDREKNGWNAARAWLWTLPRRRNVLLEEVEEWIRINEEKLSREIITMPRTQLFHLLVTQHKLIRRVEQVKFSFFLIHLVWIIFVFILAI